MAHPVFYELTRLRARVELRRMGYKRDEVNSIMDGATDSAIDLAAITAGSTLPTMTAIGDGTILQAIIDFLKSPAGQQLIAALIALLLGL